MTQHIQAALILGGIMPAWPITYYSAAPPSPRSQTIKPERKERFIAAVDWVVDQTSELVWPFASMPPANYNSVRMVVESMPRIVPRGRKTKKSEPLIASTHLRINGHLRKPDRIIRASSNQLERQEFVVKLERGRMRLTLALPPGAMIDSRPAIVKLKLYEG